nr:MAG TPA: hypothetical protein [Caudoviricetes sp.]
MAKNLIPEIAKLLGVELGEEFKIDKYDGLIFKFVDNMLVARADFKGAKWGITYAIFNELVGGEVGVIKLPWKPKKGDTFYTFASIPNKWVVRIAWWDQTPNHYALLDKGWAYRSEEEAQAALPKVAAELGVEYKI